MAKSIRCFWDCEFTGLHQHTTLISIALVAESGEQIYCELDDYDKSQVDDWLEENVIRHLWTTLRFDLSTLPYYVVGNRASVASALARWLSQWKSVEMWSDCLAYDWVLFCELFGGAMKIPRNVYYIPLDLATLFKVKGIDPDINREEFVGAFDSNKHYALHDARVIRACYFKLMEMPDA